MKDNKMTSQEQAEKTREATSRMWEARRARWEAWKKENEMRIVERKSVYRSAVYPCVTAALWTAHGEWNISYIRNGEILGRWHRGSETYIRRVWETKYPAVTRPINYCQCEDCTA